MANLVSRCSYVDHCPWEGKRSVAGNEERTSDPVLAEQLQNAANTLRPELAARNPRRRSLAARNEAGDRIEVEGEADDVTGHSNP